MYNTQIDLLDVGVNDAEECMICKEELESHECYTLPECKHRYHTGCLIAWFRNGDNRCPYCGNRGINNKMDPLNPRGFRRSRFYCTGTYENQYLSDLRKFANLKKNIDNPCVIKLRKDFEKVKLLENNLKCKNIELAEYKKMIKNEPVKYGDARKNLHNLRTTKWRMQRNLNGEKFKIVNNSYIIPLIVPMHVNID